MKRDLKTITPRALSIKLTDLSEWGLVEKKIVSTSPMNILYQLTDKGDALAAALVPMEKWAQDFIELENQ
ncbi:Transcriptional regulator, HxlR family [Staphylococcus equorum subsp. equorum]|nr:HxlR family transcriptional regulator [Staphylococcus equorum]ANK39426.1 HxlR family transcriptional regulator [Staphylococcus sp. AntiMn-1]EJX18257.1 transcriptional regulator [Staphylococcus sp. OJ82]KKI52853.1 Transcriptional regulator, HxlR family [Staphylococcus equorum subsp. equorum]